MTIRENGIVLQFDTEDIVGLCNIGLKEQDISSCNASLCSFNQVHLAGGDRDSHQGNKMIRASESSTAKFVSLDKTIKGSAIIYSLLSKTAKVSIRTEFTFFEGVKSVSIKNTVTNITAHDIVLEEVNSAFLYGIGAFGKTRAVDKLNLYVPHNSWHTEAQWKSYPLKDLGIRSGNGDLNQKKISIVNNGTWSTKEYLPMGLLEDTENNEFTLWQIESSGSWFYEVGEHFSKVYLNAGGANYEHNFWTKKLKPNEQYTGSTCTLTFGQSLNEVFANITDYRRAIRRPNKDNIDIPTIYNSYMHYMWDYPTEDTLKGIIDKVAELRLEYFCIDAGWHDEEDWWIKLGSYKESKTRFPSGVKKTIDYIRSRGMKAGIWLEIENMGVDCAALNDLPDDCYFVRNGGFVVNHNRRQLDFSHKEVRARADKIVDDLVALGIDYIKIDYNIEGGVGTETGGRNVGEGLEEHTRAYIDWIKGVYTRHENLTIENCASGGCRMDYGLLALHSIQSTSDQTDYKKYPYISANILSAVTPEQAAVWSYPLESKTDPKDLTEEAIVINMVNCLLGRMHLASDLTALSESQLAPIKEGIEFYNRTRAEKIVSKPFFPNGFASFGDTFVASGIVTKGKIYLSVWNLGGDKKISLDLGVKIKGLANAYPLHFRGVKTSYIGTNLEVEFTEIYQARIIEIEI